MPGSVESVAEVVFNKETCFAAGSQHSKTHLLTAYLGIQQEEMGLRGFDFK